MRRRLPNPKTMIYTGILAAAVAGSCLTSYAASSTASTESSAAASDSDDAHKPPKDDGSIIAKIGSVDDDTLTIYTAERPENGNNEDGQTPPEKPADGETPPEKPADGQTPPEKPADGETPPEKPADGETSSEKPADGQTPPEKPTDSDDASGKGGRPEMNFSDTASTVTVTDDTAITKGMEHTTASLSDLEEGDVVRIVLDGSEIVSIELME